MPSQLNHFYRALFLIVFSVAAACSRTGFGPVPVTVPDILRMSRSSVPPREVIRRMSESGTIYRLEPNDLAGLRNAGVADPVINYMQQTYLEAVRRDARLEDESYWHLYNDHHYRGPGF